MRAANGLAPRAKVPSGNASALLSPSRPEINPSLPFVERFFKGPRAVGLHYIC